jgi:hypothetical protein
MFGEENFGEKNLVQIQLILINFFSNFANVSIPE